MRDSSHVWSPWLRTSKETPFEFYLGNRLGDVADEKLEFNKMFNDGMASDLVLVGDVVMMTCRDVFKGLKSFVEVGGGTKTMARAIAHVFPEVECTILDLPHKINTVKEDISLAEYFGGDMFVSVPLANATLSMDNF
ncbi:probable O-methyltransferase 3 [Dioscorea cayenensis subsp. rotundata]|uniref:Probable O-methyltransferase 3 n=1 Tax=Dioscorea cayennensis subsp. rotundata TaxID=55577 RepID=A0AB40AN40_DIOCR|nr:probable O-methyltransferase 3 [Dioscorea cayenensis subsp. rotundata]